MAIDIIFVVTMLYGFYLGFSKGIIKTVFTVLSIMFGLMAAFKFAPAMTDFLESAFSNNNPLMLIAGFLLSFVLTMVIIRMIARGLEGMLKTANINIINQLAGGVLLSGVLILLYSVILWFGNQATLINSDAKANSKTYVYLEKFPTQAKDIAYKIQPVFQEFWNQSLDMMDRLEEMKPVQEETEPNIYDIPEDEETTDNSTN
jgi:membrane protein required for colicin V production